MSSAAAPPPSGLSSCPVCLGKVPSHVLTQHMTSSHTKEEIVTATADLVTRAAAAASAASAAEGPVAAAPPPPSVETFGAVAAPAPPALVNTVENGAGIHFLADMATYQQQQQLQQQQHQTRPKPPEAHQQQPQHILPSAAAPPQTMFLPQMMNMMQVMPCLIPQANGPPILFNMPSYCGYHPGMMGGAGLLNGGLMGPTTTAHQLLGQAAGFGFNPAPLILPAAATVSSQPNPISPAPVQSMISPYKPTPATTSAMDQAPVPAVVSVSQPPTLCSGPAGLLVPDPSVEPIPSTSAGPSRRLKFETMATASPQSTKAISPQKTPCSPSARASKLKSSCSPQSKKAAATAVEASVIDIADEEEEEERADVERNDLNMSAASQPRLASPTKSHTSSPPSPISSPTKNIAANSSSPVVSPAGPSFKTEQNATESSPSLSAAASGPPNTPTTTPRQSTSGGPVKLKIKNRRDLPISSAPPTTSSPPSSSSSTSSNPPLSSPLATFLPPSSSSSSCSVTLSSSSPSRITTVHDTLLSESSSSKDEINPLLMHKPSTSSSGIEGTSSSSIEGASSSSAGEPSTSKKATAAAAAAVTEPGVFSFTQYAADSPYPAASLNFSSMLLETQPSTSSAAAAAAAAVGSPSAAVSPSKTTLTPKKEPKVETPEEEEEEEEAEAEAPVMHEVPVVPGQDFSPQEAETGGPSTSAAASSAANPSEISNSFCTVQTVSDFHKVLESVGDFQIVVPEDLYNNSEIKLVLSNLQGSNSQGDPSAAPPNTPNVTRPPSATKELQQQPQPQERPSEPPSPQPCSSRDVSQAGYPDQNTASMLNDSDDDITLQDLVAMETMEDADVCDGDDEQFFSSSAGYDPFMNSILHQPPSASEGPIYTCDKCGLNFVSILEYGSHSDGCNNRMKGVGKKSKSKSSKAKSSSAAASATAASQIEPAAMQEDDEAQWPLVLKDTSEESSTVTNTSTTTTTTPATIKKEMKMEILADSSTQPALGGTGDNWKCSQCKVVFETGPQLMEHLELMRSSEHKCSSCHIIFDDRKMLLVHRRSFHPTSAKIKSEPATPRDVLPNENGEYVCDQCDRAFKDKELCIKHMSCHDEAKPHECLECGKKFAKATLLREHRRRHFEVGSFECTYCQKRFFSPNKLREHERIHTGEAPLSCNICGKSFKRHSNLSEHKRIHQENRPVKPQKELFCHCGKVFKTQRDLDWHKEGEHDKEPKKCNFCGDVFVHGSSLTRHIRMKHEVGFMPENKKSSLYAKCPICSQMLYKTSITKHIRIKHHGQKPYSCDICKKTFVTKCNLDNHSWQHKGVRSRPFKCTLCSKAYLRQSLLDAHMRSHRGVKPFVCNECGLQFANKSNWQRHVQEHSGTRNYECETCGKKFSRGYYLTDHLKVHSGDKPYVCGICGKMAATRSNYNSHLRTHVTRELVNSEN